MSCLSSCVATCSVHSRNVLFLKCSDVSFTCSCSEHFFSPSGVQSVGSLIATVVCFALQSRVFLFSFFFLQRVHPKLVKSWTLTPRLNARRSCGATRRNAWYFLDVIKRRGAAQNSRRLCSSKKKKKINSKKNPHKRMVFRPDLKETKQADRKMIQLFLLLKKKKKKEVRVRLGLSVITQLSAQTHFL